MDRERLDDWEFVVVYTCPKCGHRGEVKPRPKNLKKDVDNQTPEADT